MQQRRQHHVQNLGQYRTNAAQKYRDPFARLADNRDNNYHDKAIAAGDLVMRKPINIRNKLWPKWDGPFVVVDYTDKNTYQLGSANGYIVRRLINGERLRKLSEVELREYRGQFWHASCRLKTYDEKAKRERDLHEAEVEMRKVTLENMKLQKVAAELRVQADADAAAKAEANAAVRASMEQLAEANTERTRKEKEYCEAELKAKEEERITEDRKKSIESENHELGKRKRVRRLPCKLKN
jgi:hypothetical protein